MAYPVWPTTLENPDNPIQLSDVLPLFSGSVSSVGRFKSDRIRTRPVIGARATLLLAIGEFEIFLTFWRDTLNAGRSKFTAPWIALAGYDGYTAKIVNFSSGVTGVAPSLDLDIQFIPDVPVDGSGDPDPWPPQ